MLRRLLALVVLAALSSASWGQDAATSPTPRIKRKPKRPAAAAAKTPAKKRAPAPAPQAPPVPLPAWAEDCSNEVSLLCRAVPVSGGKLRACLESHRDVATPECRDALRRVKAAKTKPAAGAGR